MKSATATAIIIILGIVNIAALTIFAESITSYLTSSVTGANQAGVDPGFDASVAATEQRLQQLAADNDLAKTNVRQNVSIKECRSALSICRNTCQEQYNAGQRGEVIDTCYQDCEAGYRFCAS